MAEQISQMIPFEWQIDGTQPLLTFSKFLSKSELCPITKYELLQVNSAYTRNWYGDLGYAHPDFEATYTEDAATVSFRLNATDGFYLPHTYDVVIRATADGGSYLDTQV